MAALEDGFYTITKVQALAATLPSVDPGANVVLLPPSADEAPNQRWEVKRTPKGTYTITNRGNFLSFDGEPDRGKRVQGYRPPREWSLYKATDPFAYHVVVPGGPVADGEELCFDQAPVLIFPPFTWLDYLDVENQRQAWVFRRVN
ncbi:hypothetical protein BJV77DRAFT_1019249 [Russula vinacea]|nr:hypothetical protein BJV77DRAFT_1019249 [Russula vinacea]